MIPPHYPSVVIAIESIYESIKKVAEAGGKIIGKPVEIPSVGLYVSFIDTEGNRVTILQPSMIKPILIHGKENVLP